MNRTLNRQMVYLATASLVACAILAPAFAQVPGPGDSGGRGRRGEGGFGGFQRGQGGFERGPGAFGPQRGPGGILGQQGRGMRFGGSERNPRVSHVLSLIERPDVQSEIGLDLRQRNALAQYRNQMQDNLRQQMRQLFEQGRGQQGRRGGPYTPQQGGPQGEQDQRQRMEQMRLQAGQQRAQIQSGLEQGLKDVLRPQQVARLHQLDLQWRGVLSLSSPDVAAELSVSQETRASVNEMLTGYESRVRELRTQLIDAIRGQRATGTSPPSTVRQDPFLALERADKAARKEAEEKALKLLTNEESSRWNAAQGKPFTFRSDIRTPSRTP